MIDELVGIGRLQPTAANRFGYRASGANESSRGEVDRVVDVADDDRHQGVEPGNECLLFGRCGRAQQQFGSAEDSLQLLRWVAVAVLQITEGTS